MLDINPISDYNTLVKELVKKLVKELAFAAIEIENKICQQYFCAV